jgi:hypothetical protein
MACNVTRLRAAEAIIIEISNIPGFSMSYGAENHVWLLPKSFLPSHSCQVALAKMGEAIFGQPAAAAVADRAPNRYRPSDARP